MDHSFKILVTSEWNFREQRYEHTFTLVNLDTPDQLKSMAAFCTPGIDYSRDILETCFTTLAEEMSTIVHRDYYERQTKG